MEIKKICSGLKTDPRVNKIFFYRFFGETKSVDGKGRDLLFLHPACFLVCLRVCESVCMSVRVCESACMGVRVFEGVRVRVCMSACHVCVRVCLAAAFSTGVSEPPSSTTN